MLRFLAYVLGHLLNSSIVLFIVNLESETFTLVQYPSQPCCLFPDASRKDQRINLALKFNIVANNVARNTINDDVKSQLTFRI